MDIVFYVKLIFEELAIYQWQDFIEIACLSFLFHKIIYWLSKDKSSLLTSFYSYITIFLICNYFNFPLLSKMMLIGSPAVAMLFILFHDKTLQTHFVSSKKKYHKSHHDWIGELIKATLIAMNKHKDIICVIERSDSLEDILTAPAIIDAKVCEPLLTALSESKLFNEDLLLWINQKGNLVAFNAQWRHKDIENWLLPSALEEVEWRQNALFFTQKTDAIIIKLHPSTRSYEIISKGSIAEQINASQLSKFLTLACDITVKNKPPHDIIFKEINNVPHQKSFKQPQL